MNNKFLIKIKIVISIIFLSINFSEAIACTKNWHSDLDEPSLDDIPELPTEGFKNDIDRKNYIESIEKFQYKVELFRKDAEVVRYHNEVVRNSFDVCLDEKNITKKRHELGYQEFNIEFRKYENYMEHHNRLIQVCNQKIKQAKDHPLYQPPWSR